MYTHVTIKLGMSCWKTTRAFFMHTGVQKKNVSRADGCPAQRAGEEIFPTRFVKAI